MVKLGLEIIPGMPSAEVVDTIRAAEELGYESCILCDEGFMPDVYACLGAAARETSQIRLGPVTNGYTRHPMVTAVAMATLNDLSHGRALLTLVPGGAAILEAMGLGREAPVTVMRDSIEVFRRLWTGEAVRWQGQRFRLNSPPISMGRQDIPIWIAARGPKMLELAGECADGIVLMARSDLGDAIEIASRRSAQAGRRPERVYTDRIAFTPEMLAQSGIIFSYAVMDAPERMLRSMGLAAQDIERIRSAFDSGGPQAAANLVTLEMIKAFQIAGDPEECQELLRGIVNQHQLDWFLPIITSPGLDENIRLLENVRDFLTTSPSPQVTALPGLPA